MKNKLNPDVIDEHVTIAWHTLHVDEIEKKLATSLAKGLSRDESANRFAQLGANALLEKPPRPAWIKFLDQFKDLLVIVLIGAAALAGAIGDVKDAVVILVVVVFNACLGFYQ